MYSPVAIVTDTHLPAAVMPELEAAAGYARAEKAEATRRAYKSDFAIFTAWCVERDASALPAAAQSVAAFLAWEANRGTKPSTIGRRVAAIRYAHKLTGLPLPTDDERVRATVRGIRRIHGAAPAKKAPATCDRLLAMVATIPHTTKGLRDRALLLLGFAGAFRRSELVALDLENLEFCDGGLRVHIRRSKTDQDGQGATIGISFGSIACPVTAVRAWITAAGITEGPLFRPVRKGGHVPADRLSDEIVADVVKHYAKRLGLDPATFAGHSLRSGFLTSAAAKGASVFKMMDVSRHRSMDTLRGYVRDAELFRDHAGTGLL